MIMSEIKIKICNLMSKHVGKKIEQIFFQLFEGRLVIRAKRIPYVFCWLIIYYTTHYGWIIKLDNYAEEDLYLTKDQMQSCTIVALPKWVTSVSFGQSYSFSTSKVGITLLLGQLCKCSEMFATQLLQFVLCTK